MNKDTVVASVIGFGLGLVAAIALWVVPRVLPKTLPSSSPALVAEKKVEGVTDQKTSDDMTISTPTEGEIFTANSIKVQGKTSATSLVVITTANSNEVLTPKSDGSFEASVNLIEGNNQILVASHQGAEEKVTPVSVFYYPEGI